MSGKTRSAALLTCGVLALGLSGCKIGGGMWPEENPPGPRQVPYTPDAPGLPEPAPEPVPEPAPAEAAAGAAAPAAADASATGAGSASAPAGN